MLEQMRLRCYVLERDVDRVLYIRWDVRKVGIYSSRSLNSLSSLTSRNRPFKLLLL